MVLLHKFDYQGAWTEGGNYVNRYKDNDFGTNSGYLMLGNVGPSTEIYNDYAIPAGQYARFVLNYNISTYSKRTGKCKVLVQLLNGSNVIKTYESDALGDYQKQEWVPQQISGELPPEVTTIRFKIVPLESISSNTLTFSDITIRVGDNLGGLNG